MSKIAIIGAGIAGLRAAQILSSVAQVDVFEKSRGLGGRMSTRRADQYQFDHGAQYFTATAPEFERFLSPYMSTGVVAKWEPRVVEINANERTDIHWKRQCYVAAPGMTALAKAMAQTQSISIYQPHRVAALGREKAGWRLTFEDGQMRAGYDWVLSTTPAEQTAQLMPGLTNWGRVSMQGCFSLLLGFKAPLDLAFDAAIVRNNPLAWISSDSSKPGRTTDGAVSILCQSDNQWAETHMENDLAGVQATLCDAFSELTGIDAKQAEYCKVHRWRYAKVLQSLGSPFLVDPEDCLGAAGDWCTSGRVEAAFMNGSALAQYVKAELEPKAA